jgi:uncharacterized protein YjbJ (UPF0337 family)
MSDDLEGVKGKAKEVIGKAVDSPALKREGREQQRAADADEKAQEKELEAAEKAKEAREHRAASRSAGA